MDLKKNFIGNLNKVRKVIKDFNKPMTDEQFELKKKELDRQIELEERKSKLRGLTNKTNSTHDVYKDEDLKL